jgi:hypothetical protein
MNFEYDRGVMFAEAAEYTDPVFRLREYRLPAPSSTSRSAWRPDPNPAYVAPPHAIAGRIGIVILATLLVVEIAAQLIGHLRFVA